MILQKLLIDRSEPATVAISLAAHLLSLAPLIIRLAQLPQPEIHGVILQIVLDKGVLVP